MSLEPIGIFTIVAGICCLLLGYPAAAMVFVVMTVFGAAAAIVAGAANIQPAHLFLLFFAIATLSWRKNAMTAMQALRPGQPAFWLACLVVYGAASGFFSPRLLAGATQIIPVGTSEYPATGGTVPLGPVSSNVTQAIYLVADLICFVIIVSAASTRRGFAAITTGLVAYAFANMLFALLDIATDATGTQAIMQFMRNAQYALHDSETVAGMKRIIGSWPEASSFAGATLGAFGFTATMWLCGRAPRWNGPLALASLVLIFLSTSSTGLVAAPLCLVLLYLTALARSGVGGGSLRSSAVAFIAPQILAVAILIVLLNDDIYRTLYDYVDLLILSKSGTASGVERASWNAYGLQNFVDSWGLGVGLGTARTSSFPLALLSNVGIPGAVFFALFAFGAIGRRRGTDRTVPSDIRLAARNGSLCLLVGALVSGALVDLGLLFFVFAGLASVEPERHEPTLTAAVDARR
ncbi:hypothetical protein ASE04_07515 [Rhizobium sp. Root708]|uniref:hypothetical protein n=1 Tax=Rhizobium sp. Root708 TaxID=1736592 RepID=UPI0006FA318A|nr:hypothetical protein [Rhizobium sp. Root708]KRB53060.1 hypothetical protein ASE04_07515 [Rhizobium sp. Root708]